MTEAADSAWLADGIETDKNPPSYVKTRSFEPAALDLVEDGLPANATQREAVAVMHRQLRNLFSLVDRYESLLNDVCVDRKSQTVTQHTGPIDIHLLQGIRAEFLSVGDQKKSRHLTQQIHFAHALHAISQKCAVWDAKDLPVLFDRSAMQYYEKNVLETLVQRACLDRFPRMTHGEPSGAATPGFWGIAVPEPVRDLAGSVVLAVPEEAQARQWFTDITDKLAQIEKTMEHIELEERAATLLNGLRHACQHASRITSYSPMTKGLVPAIR